MAYLKYFDNIYIIDQGRIAEQGTYEQIQESAHFKDIKKKIVYNKEKTEAEILEMDTKELDNVEHGIETEGVDLATKQKGMYKASQLEEVIETELAFK